MFLRTPLTAECPERPLKKETCGGGGMLGGTGGFCVLWSGELSPLRGAEAKDCVTEMWLQGGQWREGAQSLCHGTPGRTWKIWPLKTFPSPPTKHLSRLLHCAPTAPPLRSGGFALILRRLTPGALFLFQLIFGCFPDVVRSTCRCACPQCLK